MQEWQSLIWPQRYRELLVELVESRNTEDTAGDLSLMRRSYATSEIMSFLLRESEAHCQHEETHHDAAVGN